MRSIVYLWTACEPSRPCGRRWPSWMTARTHNNQPKSRQQRRLPIMMWATMEESEAEVARRRRSVPPAACRHHFWPLGGRRTTTRVNAKVTARLMAQRHQMAVRGASRGGFGCSPAGDGPRGTQTRKKGVGSGSKLKSKSKSKSKTAAKEGRPAMTSSKAVALETTGKEGDRIEDGHRSHHHHRGQG